jgi:5-methylcytosine-specific restriction enzyme A
MPYGYKQPANWKTTRRRILARDGHACYICGAPAAQVDALTPESQGGTHTDDANLGAICKPHHEAKSKAERLAGIAARPRVTRTPENHPGLA